MQLDEDLKDVFSEIVFVSIVVSLLSVCFIGLAILFTNEWYVGLIMIICGLLGAAWYCSRDVE